MSKKKSKVLVCPLDWGIGHATRCVPVIRHLRDQGAEVLIAAGGNPLAFLRGEFPELAFIPFPGPQIRYSRKKRMLLRMLLQAPRLIAGIWQEHRRLRRIIREHDIDAVISDNRFGLWSAQVPSVYITHQVMIKAPHWGGLAEPLLHRIHGWFISRYDECWIPDEPGDNNLSGDLAHRYPPPGNSLFVGPLSRFEKPHEPARNNGAGPDWLFLLSGPEPQRTVFEEIIISELGKGFPGTAVILQGLPAGVRQREMGARTRILPHLPDEALRDLILSAGKIVCRPGYSTLMDLAMLGRTAVLVPTPGQTEQEYLAGHAARNGRFRVVCQDQFRITEITDLAGTESPERIVHQEKYKEAIDRLLLKLKARES